MKELAIVGLENVCRVWIQNESPDTEPLSFSILDTIEAHEIVSKTFLDLWNKLTFEEKNHAKTLLTEEQKWAEENDQKDHILVYNRTIEVISEIEQEEGANHYYQKYISDNGIDGRWNVIQVINDVARYFVLKGDIKEPEPMPFISQGFIAEDNVGLWYTDGDFINLDDWEKVQGTLLKF